MAACLLSVLAADEGTTMTKYKLYIILNDYNLVCVTLAVEYCLCEMIL